MKHLILVLTCGLLLLGALAPARLFGQCLTPALGTSTTTTNSITVNWATAPSATVGYTLVWRIYDPAFPTAQTTVGLPSSATTYLITGLTANTQYEIKLSSVCNAANTSPAATAILTTQANPAPPAPCLSPVITSFQAGDTQLQLGWTTGGGAIEGYRVEYRTGTGNFLTQDVVGNVTQGTLTGLTANALYEIRVRTRCTGGVLSAPGSSNFIRTQPTLCPAPMLNAPTPAANSLFVSWNALAEATTGYRLEYRVAGAANWTAEDVSANTTALSLTGLSSGTLYELRLMARCGGALLSAPSTVVQVATSGFTCPAPTITNATPSQNEIALSWTAVATAALGYRVEFRTGNGLWNGVNISAGATTYTIPNLSNGTTYEVRVQSRCTAAASSAFVSTTATTLSPCATPNFTSPDLSPNALTVRWTGGGSNLTGYRLTYRLTGNPNATTMNLPPSQTQFTLGGLAPSTQYTFELQALCGAALSVSTSQNYSTQSVAGCPAPIIRSLQPSNTTILVQFSGSNVPHAGYSLEYRLSPGGSWSRVELPASPNLDANALNTYTVSGLTADAAYDVRLRTRCTDGSVSGWETGSTRTLISSCPPPTILSAQGGFSAITLTWSGPQNQIFVQGFQIRYQALPDGNLQFLEVPAFNNSATISNLLPGRDYEIALLTQCSIIDFSAPALRTVRTQGVPCDRPSVPVVTAGARTANVSWTISAGTPVASYTVEYKQAFETNWTMKIVGPAPASTTLDGLLPETFYDVRVRTNCSTGSFSEYSTASFMTQAVPCDPPALTLGDRTASTILVSWAAATEALMYELEWRVAGGNWSGVGLSGTSFLIQGLLASTNYEVRIRSICSGMSGNRFSAYATQTTRTLDPPCPSVQLTNVTPLSNGVFMSWIPVPDAASGYRLRWKRSVDPNFSEIVLPFVITSFTIVNLQASTEYQIEIASLCAPDRASDPTVRVVSTTQQFCEVPAIQATAPENESILVIWNLVATASSGYVVSWRETGGSFSEALVNAGVNNFRVSGLRPGVSYELRLRSRCSTTNLSDWSPFFFTTTTSDCSIPDYVDLLPEALAMNVEWGAMPNAVGYRISWGRFGGPYQSVDVGPGSNTYRITNLTPDTEYEVQVRTICANNLLSDPNFGFEFTLRDFCVPPSNLTLTPGVDHIAATWQTVGAATSGYQLEWRLIGEGWRTVVLSQNGFTIPNLASGRAYEVRVYSLCDSRLSNTFALATALTLTANSCPTPTIGVVSTTATSATVNWNFLSAAGRGTVVEWQAINAANWNAAQVAPGQTQFTITGLTGGTAYRVRLRSLCAATEESPNTAPRDFTTPNAADCPAPVITNTNATFTAISLQWIAVSGATGYRIEYYPTSNPNATRFIDLTQPLSVYLVQGLTPGTEYAFRVSTRCRSLTSALGPEKRISTTGFGRQGTENEGEAASIRLYPNPNQGAFVLSWTAAQAGVAAFELYDVAGRLAGSQQAAYEAGAVELQLDFGKLPAGVYLLRRADDPGFRPVRMMAR